MTTELKATSQQEFEKCFQQWQHLLFGDVWIGLCGGFEI
jgi:hypothetical protein